MRSATIAAIDIGSNAIRLAIGTVSARGNVRILETSREPVRLGASVFAKGAIGPQASALAIGALHRFHRRIGEHSATIVRAVGTSALREATDSAQFIRKAYDETGIPIVVVSGEEEARLIFRGVTSVVRLGHGRALLLDIGGGSVEITVAARGRIQATETFAMGTVRLLAMLRRGAKTEEAFVELAREYVAASHRRIREELGSRAIAMCVGTGGNVEALADLGARLYRQATRTRQLSLVDLDRLIVRIRGLSVTQRIGTLGLRPDRADVILPAAIVIRQVLFESGVKFIRVPGVGLREGLLQELAEEYRTGRHGIDRPQAIASAHALGIRFQYDERHARRVAAFSTALFDATRSLHRLGAQERALLEISAIVHDIGHRISPNGHHKHSYYLINASPIVGLSDEERAIVANVARYHRKSMPKPSHAPYVALSPSQRSVVDRLAAILRIADGLDNDHAVRRRAISARVGRDAVRITMSGVGTLLEQWSSERRSDLFERTFGRRVEINTHSPHRP